RQLLGFPGSNFVPPPWPSAGRAERYRTASSSPLAGIIACTPDRCIVIVCNSIFSSRLRHGFSSNPALVWDLPLQLFGREECDETNVCVVWPGARSVGTK